MRKKLALIALTLCLAATYQAPSWAGKVLDKIKQTGVITAGTRKDAIPFAYVNEQGKWVGYSVDILEIIRKDVEKKLGKPIKLQLVEVTPQNRFEKIKNGSIDIECASTTFTWERDKQVDFTVSYFASGTKILVKKGSQLGTIESLAGRKVGVIPNTTNEQVIKIQQPAAKLVTVKDRNEGLKKLEAGEIEAFASDGILLQGLKKEAKNPNTLQVVPEFPYAYESYSCMVPQDESAWRDTINYSLVKFMEGIISDQPKTVTIYEKWFGDGGVTPYSREIINDYFQGIVNSYEWIPIVEY
jgi:polar amino acid transport system substrate-binding protein